MIVNDPVKYTESMSPEFKSFLKGLLNKTPNERLGWPDLLNHPFISETEQEKTKRQQRTNKYLKWVGNEQPLPEISRKLSMNTTDTPDLWPRYEALASDEAGATKLRHDSQFLDRLISLISAVDLPSKDKLGNMLSAVKALVQVVSKGKSEDPSQDILKAPGLSTALFSLTQSSLKAEQQGGNIQVSLLTEVVRAIGLITRATFSKSLGIEQGLTKQFLPLIPELLRWPAGADNGYLAINTIKTTGIILNQAGLIPLRCSFVYREVLENKVLQELAGVLKANAQCAPNSLSKSVVQALAVTVHPSNGEVFLFPWKRGKSELVAEYNATAPVFEAIRQGVWDQLSAFDWLHCLCSIFHVEDDGNITKISVLRVLLQMIRVSRDGADVYLAHAPTMSLLNTLIRHEDAIISALALQILTHMLKQLGALKRKHDLDLDSRTLLALLKSNLAAPEAHVVAMATSCLLAELLQTAPSRTVETLVKGLVSSSILGELVNFVMPRNYNRQEELKRVEGSGYGCVYMGFADGPVLLIQRLLAKFIAPGINSRLPEFFTVLTEEGAHELVVALLNNLAPKSELSPKGLISLLTFTHDAMYFEFRVLLQKILQDGVMKALAGLLKENQLLSVQEWPVLCGGGSSAVGLIVAQVLRIFNLPFTSPAYTRELEPSIQELAASDVVHLTLSIMKYLSKEHLAIAVSLLSRLVVHSDSTKPFAQQFTSASGMQILPKYSLLGPESPTHLLVDTLSLVSQIARLSKENYELIHQVGIYKDLRRLIEHRDSAVRSKVCNLLGNICRHSSFFYDIILDHDLISAAINCCRDEDRNTRKFACFAVGNAGFHNHKLYEHLRPCVPLLVNLLRDQEEKTRANAAGALGNFVRNSDLLCNDLIAHGALRELLEVVKNDPGPSQSPRQVALFSIGNLCVYPPCKEEFEKLSIRPIIDKLLGHRDPQVLKYSTRILQKLGN